MKDQQFLLLHELMDQIGKFSGNALLGCDGIGEAVVCPGDDVDPVGVAVDVDSHIVGSLTLAILDKSQNIA